MVVNLVQNGNFQTGDFSGWNNSTNTLQENGIGGLNYYQAGNTQSNVNLSQTIATTPGNLYTLFYYLLNTGGGPTQYFAASLDGGSTVLPDSIMSVTDGYLQDTGWLYYRFTFTATSSSVDLTFITRQDPGVFMLTYIWLVNGDYNPASLGGNPGGPIHLGADIGGGGGGGGGITCFKEDTLILTDGGYKKIQELRKGDLVRTLGSGFKAVALMGRRIIKHTASEERIPDQLYICSTATYPSVFEDLYITGCHSILVDEFLDDAQREAAVKVNGGDLFITENKYRLPACVDTRAVVFGAVGEYMIYHLALDNADYYMNYGVYANGLLVESCSLRYLTELSGMDLFE